MKIVKTILSIALIIMCIACNGPRPPRTDLNAATAKAVLLDLMRSDTSPFEGADPARFEKIEIEDKGEGKFGWGAFIIDVSKKTYVADVDAPDVFWSYSGRFTIDPSGRWKAENLTATHGLGLE